MVILKFDDKKKGDSRAWMRFECSICGKKHASLGRARAHKKTHEEE